MSNIGKFQLPPIKGTDVFPETVQAPPVVRATVKFTTDPREPYNPEVLSDYVKDVLSEHSARLGHFVQTQRQNYNAGVVEFAKTSRSFPEFDVSYSNNQGKHEIVYVTLKVDIRRAGGKKEKYDALMLLVLHDGYKLSAIPMSALDNGQFTSAYRHTCQQSFWGNAQFIVNQLRLGDDYSVIASEINLADGEIVSTFASVMIATDDPNSSLSQTANCNNAYLPLMNGGNGSIFLAGETYAYDGTTLSLVSTGDRDADAIDSNGTLYTVKFDGGSTYEYYNSISVGGSRNAQSATIRVAVGVGSVTGTVTASVTSTVIGSKSSGDGPSSGQCGAYPVPTPDPQTITHTESRSNTTYSWDGINLGSSTNSYTVVGGGSSSIYLVTSTTTFQPFRVGWVYASNPSQIYETSKGGGSITSYYTSAAPVTGSSSNTPVSSPYYSDCDVLIRGSPMLPDSWVDEQVAMFLNSIGDCNGGCWTSSTQTSSLFGTNVDGGTIRWSGTSNFQDATGYIFPYAVDDKLYYRIRDTQSMTIFTPHGQSYSGGPSMGFTGWLNVTNNRHLIQGYLIDQAAYIVLDGALIGNDIASVCRTSIDNINAIFMDIPLSKIVEFD